jgi:ABC-type Fe3+ transport system permease subunit
VARELRSRGHEVTVWVSGRSIENSVMTAWDGPTFSTRARPLHPKYFFSLLYSRFRCGREMKRFKPHALLAMGSYSSLPPVMAASAHHVPVVLHEANTVPGRAVAYLARYLSFSMKTSSAALLQVHSSLEEAARVCGASHTESLADVTLPLIRPAMVSGFFLIFLPAMREVTTSILLYGPYTRTLGVQIYSLRDAGMIPQAAALATVAIGIIIILNTIVTKLTKDRKGV